MNGHAVNGFLQNSLPSAPPPEPFDRPSTPPPPPPELQAPPSPPEDFPPPPPPAAVNEQPPPPPTEVKKKTKQGWGPSSYKQPLSVEEILRKKKEADEAASKVCFNPQIYVSYVYTTSFSAQGHTDLKRDYVAQILIQSPA